MPERKQAGMTADWWAVTALHESAHALAAFALGCQPLEVELNRRLREGNSLAGVCRATYEKTWYGDVANIYVQNAPFVAHQYEATPCGEKEDLHERDDAYREFSRLIGCVDEALFRRCVDEPLYAFFGSADIQGAVLALAQQLYQRNRVSLKQVAYWTKKLDLPSNVCERLSQCCLQVAQAIAGEVA